MTAAGPPSKAQLIKVGTRVLAEESAAVRDVIETVRTAGGA